VLKGRNGIEVECKTSYVMRVVNTIECSICSKVRWCFTITMCCYARLLYLVISRILHKCACSSASKHGYC
jgi:hypothetical protein